MFHFREEKGRDEAPDNITLKLDIDDKVLKQIIQNLYYPDSACEFFVLPADILGQVYEQFLGKVIRLTAGHQAKVEDKPEVKKAGGVFYTPTYIVGGVKIIFPDIATGPRFAMDDVGYFSSNTTYFIPKEDLYLLALLNSRLGNFYFSQTCAGLEGKNETYLRFFGQYLEGFPVKEARLGRSAEKSTYGTIVKFVSSIVDLHKKLPLTKTAHEKTILQRQIDAADRRIDELVYELYGLSEEEIKIVESAGKRGAE